MKEFIHYAFSILFLGIPIGVSLFLISNGLALRERPRYKYPFLAAGITGLGLFLWTDYLLLWSQQ